MPIAIMTVTTHTLVGGVRSRNRPEGVAMTTKTLKDLFIHSLSDIYSAEQQMTTSLPKMARASTNPGLRSAFEMHLEETRGQIERIDRAARVAGSSSSATS